jgi:hypothetical protein
MNPKSKTLDNDGGTRRRYFHMPTTLLSSCSLSFVIEDEDVATAASLAAIDNIASFIIVVDGDDVAVRCRLALRGLGETGWTLVTNAMSVAMSPDI